MNKIDQTLGYFGVPVALHRSSEEGLEKVGVQSLGVLPGVEHASRPHWGGGEEVVGSHLVIVSEPEPVGCGREARRPGRQGS